MEIIQLNQKLRICRYHSGNWLNSIQYQTFIDNYKFESNFGPENIILLESNCLRCKKRLTKYRVKTKKKNFDIEHCENCDTYFFPNNNFEEIVKTWKKDHFDGEKDKAFKALLWWQIIADPLSLLIITPYYFIKGLFKKSEDSPRD